MYLSGLDGKLSKKLKKVVKAPLKLAVPLRKSTVKKIGKSKIVKKTGKLLVKAAPLIAFIPGVGTAAAAAIKLAGTADQLRKQRRAKREAGQQTAAIDAEIAATEKEIARLQGGGLPLTANASIGLETAQNNALPQGHNEFDDTKISVAKTAPKKIPWTLIGGGLTLLTMLKK